MKLSSKIKFILLAFILTVILWNARCLAISISVNPSKTTVSPGQSFSVTIKGTDATGKVGISVSGGSASTSSIWVENNSQTITVTAGSSGTVSIYASGELSNASGSDDKNVSASASVKIVQPSSGGGSSPGGNSGGSSNNNTTTPTEKEKSKDSTLSALSVKEGAITPEFKKDVKEYTLIIPYEVSEINVTATPTDSKATVAVEGNKDLKEGENTVTVKVTAEDGSTSNYLIKATRSRAALSLKTLVIKYENQDGELIEIPLNPEFAFDKLEYTLEDLEYWVEKLNIEATANLEDASIEIQGADNLQVGENTITITLKIAAENAEEPKEEIITYTIKVNKKEEPTLIAKISNWFNGLMGTVKEWYDQNTEKVILGALGVCIVALIGLSAYIVVDYNKYKDVIAKVKKTSEINTSENIIEDINHNSNNAEENITDNSDNNDKTKGGKHFNY